MDHGHDVSIKYLDVFEFVARVNADAYNILFLCFSNTRRGVYARYKSLHYLSCAIYNVTVVAVVIIVCIIHNVRILYIIDMRVRWFHTI